MGNFEGSSPENVGTVVADWMRGRNADLAAWLWGFGEDAGGEGRLPKGGSDD